MNVVHYPWTKSNKRRMSCFLAERTQAIENKRKIIIVSKTRKRLKNNRANHNAICFCHHRSHDRAMIRSRATVAVVTPSSVCVIVVSTATIMICANHARATPTATCHITSLSKYVVPCPRERQKRWSQSVRVSIQSHLYLLFFSDRDCCAHGTPIALSTMLRTLTENADDVARRSSRIIIDIVIRVRSPSSAVLCAEHRYESEKRKFKNRRSFYLSLPPKYAVAPFVYLFPP